MKKLFYAFIAMMIPVMAAAQGYTNPVIPGYHPDPSVCRVGEKFYLVNSTFQYFPGVPIFESTDLAHWTQIGNVLDRESQVPLKGTNSWLGVYAPTIRYHEGVYYMITTIINYPDTQPGRTTGNFYVTATDPAGPWSEPIWLDQGGIDPTLIFEDGKCYFVSNPDNTITLCEIDPKTGEQLTESRALWQGTGGRCPEGPHIYKKDGYYYLLIAEGGTESAHSITIARSRDIYGPYEANPANPILTHCSLKGQSSPIQGTGHGDIVQAADGSWWIVFLAYRSVAGYFHHLGRETFLAPVEWNEGEWPVINGGEPVLLDMADVTLPGVSPDNRYVNSAAKGFDTMGFEWVYMQNPDMSKYEHVGTALRLHCSESSLSENVLPTFVGRRQEAMAVTATSLIDAANLQSGDEAGITVYQIQGGHLDIALRKNADGTNTVINRATVRSLVKETELLTLKGDKAYLRIESDGTTYRLSVSEDGTAYTSSEPYDTPLVSTEVVGGFTGVVLGMYAAGKGSADFSYFDYIEN